MPRIATRCPCCDATQLDRQSAVLMPFVARRALGWEPCEVTAEWGLRDLPVGHALALCSTLHCPGCGLVFLDMRFDDAEMARLYHAYRGPVYEAERESFEPGYAVRNRALVAGDAHVPAVEAFLRPWVPAQPALLDWGGDTGLNTPLRAVARLHHVLDISGQAPIEGVVAVQRPSTDPYDLIVLAHVLEHIPEPASLLAEVAAAMAPATRLYVEVPFEALMRAAVGDPLAWRRKRHWHEHVNFFSEGALRALLQRCDLQMLATTQLRLAGGAVALGLICERA